MLGQRSTRALTHRRRSRGRVRSRRTGVRRPGLLSLLWMVVIGSVLHVTGTPSASTASAHLSGSSARQVQPHLASAPIITGIDEGDARLAVAFTGTSGAAPEAYEYSTDGGVTWRLRDDGGGTTTPVTITAISAAATPLINGTTYLVRLRALTAAGQGRVSNLVAATPRSPVTPPPVDGSSVRWLPLSGTQHIVTDPERSAIVFRGAGERRALVDMAPTSRSTLELSGTQFTQGNGWGVIVHGGIDAQDRLEGYVVQFDRGSGGRVVVRYWQGDSEFNRPLATSDSTPVSNDVHDVRIEVDGERLRVVFDGEEVLVVADLPAATAEVGASGPFRTDGVLGLRASSSTDLAVTSARLSVG